MFIKYNNVLYDLLDRHTHLIIITKIESKTDEKFLRSKRSYYKEISTEDTNIQEIFDVDFILTYIDTSETIKHGEYVTKWNVNEGRPMYRNPEIENDEIGLCLPHDSWSEDWTQDDKYSCSKIVNINECSDYMIVFTYLVKDGEKLNEPLIKEKEVPVGEFKEQMIKYRKSNI